jgi:hyaluronate lyase
MKVLPRLGRPSMLLATLLQCALMSSPAHADPDVYDNLRAKWIGRTSSAPALPATDPDIAMQPAASGNDGSQASLAAMNQAADRTYLWADLPLGSVSVNLNTTVDRLTALANAYNNPSSPSYQQESVRSAVLSGMDWLVANAYSATGTGYDNWWHWQIGVPLSLEAFMFSFYDQLSSTQIANYIAAIDHYMPNPVNRANMDGSPSTITEVAANLTDKCLVAILRGVLGKDGSKITQGANAFPSALAYVTSGDGFYADGSFVQHGSSPYIGNYGTVLLGDVNKVYYLLNNTDWSLAGNANYLKPYEWAMNAFRDVMYDGAVMDNQRGRMITVKGLSDHTKGRNIVGFLAELAQLLPATQAGQLKSVIKGWVQRDGTFGDSYFTPVPGNNMAIFDIELVRAIMDDSSIAAAPEPTGALLLPTVDRAMMRGPDFGISLAMFSKRTTAFEYGNGQNLRGWWTGQGMTALYNADQLQYGGNYWATINMWRLPGTTTDHTGSGTPVDWKFYSNSKPAVGGAVLNGQFATNAMEFASVNVTGSPLVGKKVWFMFGDRMVALGSSITNTNGADVETIVDNRALNGAGDNILTVNAVGNTKPATLGWTEVMPAVSWAHLAGNTSSGSDIGYVFPGLATVTGLRESRTGAWSDVQTGASTTPVTANYLSLAVDHGVNPNGAVYTYVVLPNRSAQETADFAAANPITVLERSWQAAAVRDTSQGLTGVVYWNDGAKTVNVNGSAYLTSDKKAVVTLQQQGSDLQLAVADPTQSNTGVINLEYNGAADAVVSADPAITVSQTSPTIKMAVAVNGAKGKSFQARFTLNNTQSLTPSADAYVRDGTYASSNFGTATTLTVKQDATGYARKSLLKFDLSSVTGGTITSAKLTLTPTTVGSTGITHNLYQSSSDTWTEGALTWNTAPANGNLLTSWTVPAVNTPVVIDLTSVANGALSGDKILALEVESAANYGSAGTVDYGSKENANVSYRPTLVITSH